MQAAILQARSSVEFGGLSGALGIDLIFRIPTKDAKRWGQWCPMKPDGDNLAKAVCDVLENCKAFAVGDQQLADTRVRKFWSKASEAGVQVRLFALEAVEREPVPDWLTKK